MKWPPGPCFWAAGWGGWWWRHRSRGGHEFGATAAFSASGCGRSVSADTRGSTGLSLRAQSISSWISASGRSWSKACPLCTLNLWETKAIRNESTMAVNKRPSPGHRTGNERLWSAQPYTGPTSRSPPHKAQGCLREGRKVVGVRGGGKHEGNSAF